MDLTVNYMPIDAGAAGADRGRLQTHALSLMEPKAVSIWCLAQGLHVSRRLVIELSIND
jgi:hypothetical protein